MKNEVVLAFVFGALAGIIIIGMPIISMLEAKIELKYYKECVK